MKQVDKKENLTSIGKALYIIKFLSKKGGGGLSLKEVSSGLGFNKSTTHRILDTLQDHGYARQDKESKEYKPGLRLVEIGEKVLEDIDIRKEAHPELRKLADKTNEVVHLGIIESGKVVYLDKFDPPERTFQIYSSVGKQAPVHCTGLGKALLAFLSTRRRNKILEQQELEEHTSQTITSLSKLREELEEIRKLGYAYDNKEHENEVRCLAAPIRNHNGESQAAISISTPSYRTELEDLKGYVPEIKEAANRISDRLGHKKDLL